MFSLGGDSNLTSIDASFTPNGHCLLGERTLAGLPYFKYFTFLNFRSLANQKRHHTTTALHVQNVQYLSFLNIICFNPH